MIMPKEQIWDDTNHFIVKKLFPLEYTDAIKIWETHRNYTLMLLLVTSGMRSGEWI